MNFPTAFYHNLSMPFCIIDHIPFFSRFMHFPKPCKIFRALPFFSICLFEKLYSPNVKIAPNAKTMYNCVSIDAPSLYATNHEAIMMKFKHSMLMVVPICEKPKSMNMWCKCVLSGLNGDFLCNIRVDITRTVSKTGIDNTAIVNGISPTPFNIILVLDRLASNMLITNIDIIVPTTSVPLSPINILVLYPNTL